MTDVLVAVLWI